ncbi:MAG TPA: DsbC family protein [Burkholderiaceae bacterium]|nr:DsbC family protein [Burkholderiaceae bacterium]
MKRLLIAAAFALGTVMTPFAFAQADKDATEASVKSALQARLGANAPIDQVRKAPMSGLWEARVGDDIVYTDAQANYLLLGNLIDAKTRQNLTQARLDDLNRISFKDLPLDLAVKTVRGKGERVIVEFSDPNCGYCKRFRQGIAGMENVTIYTFLYPILSPDSEVKSRQIWCSANKQKALDDWMVKGVAPSGNGDCSNPIQKVVELGQKYKVSGTPTLFFADGRRVAGAIPQDRVEAMLAQSSAKK